MSIKFFRPKVMKYYEDGQIEIRRIFYYENHKIVKKEEINYEYEFETYINTYIYDDKESWIEKVTE